MDRDDRDPTIFRKKIALLWIGDPKLEVHVNSYFQFFTKPPTYQFENKT